MKYNNNIKSIAIGSFDGIHIAHQKLIEQVEALVIIERNSGYLTPGYKRTLYTSKVCCFYHFEKIKSLDPQGFVAKLEEDFPQLEKMVVGYDFVFGENRTGNTEALQKYFNGKVEVVQEVSKDGIPVHSRTIKAYLKDGNIQMANRLLGREYSIEGSIVSGQGLGKNKLVATLNLDIKEYQLPLEGVYAARTKIENRWFDSVSFLGHRVSTDGTYAVETHLLDEDIGEVKGIAEISFMAFMRENRKFETIEALKDQINMDIEQAKEVLC